MLHIWVNSNMAVEAVRQSMHSFVTAPPGQNWFLSLDKVSANISMSISGQHVRVRCLFTSAASVVATQGLHCLSLALDSDPAGWRADPGRPDS